MKEKDPAVTLRKEHPELDELMEFLTNYVGSDIEVFQAFIFELVDYRTSSWEEFDSVINVLNSYRECV